MKRNYFKISTALFVTLALIYKQLRGLLRVSENLYTTAHQGIDGLCYVIFFIAWIVVAIVLGIIPYYKMKHDPSYDFEKLYNSLNKKGYWLAWGLCMSNLIGPFIGWLVIYGLSILLAKYTGLNLNALIICGLIVLIAIVIGIILKYTRRSYEKIIFISYLWLYFSGIVYYLNKIYTWFNSPVLLTISMGILAMLCIKYFSTKKPENFNDIRT